MEGEAWDILAQAEETEANSPDGGALGEAIRFLLDALKNGPEPASEVKQCAEAVGINEKTLSRARKSIGVKSSKTGMKGGWEWSLPDEQNAEGGQATPKKDNKFCCPPSENLVLLRESE